MANEIRPEDVRRIAAQKEREVLGDGGLRRFPDQQGDYAAQQGHAMPPLKAEPRLRGPYDRNLIRTNPPPLDLETETDSDDDLGLPPSYSATDYGRADDYEYEAEQRPRRSRWLPVSVAVLALLGFAGVVWYAYDWSSAATGGGKIPVIQASVAEDKVKPTNEAGMDVPNQESTVLNPQAAKAAEEVLMPPPEEPVVLVDPKAVNEDVVVLLGPSSVSTAPAAPKAPSADGSMQPAGTDTIAAIIAAQSQPQQQAQASAPSVESIEAEGEGTQAVEAPAAEPVPSVAIPPAAPAVATAGQAPAVTPAAAPAAPTVPVPATGSASQPAIQAGAFLIQLASLTSVEAAEQTWSRLQRQHAGLLGDMAVNIQKAEIDGKGTYFRVQAGPLPNRATADDMCAQLKAAQQDCIVVKR